MKVTVPELTVERAVEPGVWFVRKKKKYVGMIRQVEEKAFRAVRRGVLIGTRESVDMAALLFRDETE